MGGGPGVAWFLSSRGLSSQAADSSVVREGVCNGVTSELRSPKGLEAALIRKNEEGLVRGMKQFIKGTNMCQDPVR